MTDAPDMPPQVPNGRVSATDQPAAVLAAMDRLQNRGPDWTRLITLVLVSLVLFAGVGAVNELLPFLAILLGVMTVHELGHFVSMRWFGYRNVTMFYMPFFGAAVAGRTFDVESWKKVVVSLMGPVPGIGLGCLFGALAVYARDSPDSIGLSHELLFKIATVTIVINGFHLLPILPLDGGWVMHALIFCRNPFFDTGFRLLGAMLLLVLGITTGAWLMLFIGCFLLLGLPASYRMAGLTVQLRTEAIQKRADANGNIPPDTANRIIDGIRQASVHSSTPQIVATRSLHVFETLNTSPPGIFLSLFLAAVHALSLIIALAVTFILMIENQGSNLGEFFALANQAPRYTYRCGSIETWYSPDWKPELADETLLLIAHRDSRKEAVSEFQKLTGSPPASGSVMRFGQTLLVETDQPTDRDTWRRKLEVNGNILQPKRATVRFYCSLPSIELARETVSDCEEYAETFHCATWLAPPWSHPDNLTKDGREYIRRARHTVAKVRERQRQLLNQADPEIDTGKQRKLLEKCIAEIRRSSSEPVEHQVLDLMLETGPVNPDLSAPLAPPGKLADLLGRLIPNPEDATGHDRHNSRCSGVVATQGAFLVLIETEGFQSTTAGLARVSKWLCGQGTDLIQYDIQATLPEQD